jgi:aarF domain-containing kinase
VVSSDLFHHPCYLLFFFPIRSEMMFAIRWTWHFLILSSRWSLLVADPTVLKLWENPMIKVGNAALPSEHGSEIKSNGSSAVENVVIQQQEAETVVTESRNSLLAEVKARCDALRKESHPKSLIKLGDIPTKLEEIQWKCAFMGLPLQWKKYERFISGPQTALFLSAALFVKASSSEPLKRATYFWMHAGPIVGHYMHTQWRLKRMRQSTKEERERIYTALHDRYAQPALDLILHLRGLYAKIGQVLSARPDMMPHQYTDLFETLQDSIPQWPIESVRDIISKSLKDSLDVDMDDVLDSIEPKALGSASIGQVHKAVLSKKWFEKLRNDHNYAGGRTVAIKVMHPGAEARFAHDFQVFRWLCRMALPQWHGILDELERRVMTEFDYKNEAASLVQVRQNLMNSPYRDRVCVPEPLTSLCCKEVLVMEMLNGPKLITAIQEDLHAAFGDQRTATEFLAERKKEVISGEGRSMEILQSLGWLSKLRLQFLVKKCRRYVKLLVDVHGKQIFEDGIFNGDCHFGNVLRLDDGRLGLIDYGQTRRLTDEERIKLSRIVAAIGQGCDDSTIATAMRDLGFSLERDDDDKMLVKYGKIFFDSDQEGAELGFATPQHYFESLMKENSLKNIPDSASKFKPAL